MLAKQIPYNTLMYIYIYKNVFVCKRRHRFFFTNETLRLLITTASYVYGNDYANNDVSSLILVIVPD